MQARTVLAKTLGVVATIGVASAALAQTPGPASNISSVVRGGVVVVSYDLAPTNASSEFSILLEASSDGGKTYTVRPQTVKGDVGPAVRAGIGKQITWEAAKDVESLTLDQYRYRVLAQPARAAETPRAQAPTPLPVAASTSKRGSGGKWGGIALMGAGGALAVLGTTVLKQEYYDPFYGDYWTETNKTFVWSGIAAAAGGATLFMLSGSKDDSGVGLSVKPHGVMLQYRMPIMKDTRSGAR
jgi:hypothetical protein